jgi:hypothetical protein
MIVLVPTQLNPQNQAQSKPSPMPTRIVMALPNNGRICTVKVKSLQRQFENRQVTEVDKDHLGVMLNGTLCIVSKEIPKLKFLKARFGLASEIVSRAEKGDLGGIGAYFAPSELSQESQNSLLMVFADTQIEPEPKVFMKTSLLGVVNASSLFSTRRGVINASFGPITDKEEGARSSLIFSGRNSRVGTVRQKSDPNRSFDTLREQFRESYRFAVGFRGMNASSDGAYLLADAVETIYNKEFNNYNDELLKRAVYLKRLFPKWLDKFSNRKTVEGAELAAYQQRLVKQLANNLYDENDARETAASAVFSRDSLDITVQAKAQADPSGPATEFVASFRVWP